MIRSFIYCILFTLVLVTPFMFSDGLYSGIVFAKQIWFWFATGVLIFFYGAENLFGKGKTELRLNRIDVSLLVFYFYFFIRACYTPFTPILYNQKFLNYTLLVLFYFIVNHSCKRVDSRQAGINVADRQKENSLIAIIALVLMLTGFVEAIWGLMQLYGFTRSFHSGYKITGTFVNPAPYALYLAAIFPITLYFVIKELRNEKIKELQDGVIMPFKISLLIKEFKKGKSLRFPNSFIPSFLHSLIKAVSLLTMISILLVLPATMNRASWIGVVVSSFLVFNYRYKLSDQLFKQLTSRKRKFAVIAGLLVVLVSIGVALYHLKAGSSFGRRFIWEVTAGKIAEKPLFGHGIGRFEAEYNNWQADYFKKHPEEMNSPKGMAAGNTKYCYNEYLEMAAESGIIGLILFLAIIFSVFHGISRVIKKETSSFSIFPAFLFSFISILLCALVSFPFYSLSNMILLILALGILSSAVKVQDNLSISPVLSNGLFRKSICFLLLPVSVLLLNWGAQQQYRAYQKWDEAASYYQNSMYKESCQSFSQVYKSLRYNGPCLQYYGKAQYLNEQYAESLELLEQALNFTSGDCDYSYHCNDMGIMWTQGCDPRASF